MTLTVTTTTLPKGAIVFNDILPPVVCYSLIELFDELPQEDWDRNGAPKFTQVNINRDQPGLVEPLVTFTRTALEKYKSKFPVSKYLPPLTRLEEFRVKRYNGGSEDRYDDHIDVQGSSSANRYLSFLFYLNDDFTGGETEFSEGGIVTPQRGSVLVFPPYWMFPHAGKRVITGTKYIMSTYMHLT